MRRCIECDEPTERPATAEPVLCAKCYNRLHPKYAICWECDRRSRTHGVNNDSHTICKKCYEVLFLTEICAQCGQAKGVSYRAQNGDAFCASCYYNMRAPVECSLCHRMKPKHTEHAEHGSLCKVCYNKTRRKENPHFALIENLRSRARSAFGRFCLGGKVRSSKEYGIDYKSIVEHIGMCPGQREDYHVDHVFPLSAFDFSKPEHIRAAFAPENHQWLPKQANLSKQDTYDRQAFLVYIEHCGVQE